MHLFILEGDVLGTMFTLFQSVDSRVDVRSKTLQGRKPFLAQLAEDRLLFLDAVHALQVRLHGLLDFEPLAAHLAVISVLFRVDQLVSDELRPPAEVLPAVLAFKRSYLVVSYVDVVL